jgi:hypothetical protein
MARWRWGMAALLALAAVGSAGAAETHWLHIRVEEAGEPGSHVRVNVPLAMLETLAASAGEAGTEIGPLHGGSVKLGRTDMSTADLRRMWGAVRDAADMEFVTVEQNDETVRVAKDHGHLVMRVQSRDGGKQGAGDRVEAKIPLDVIDALLSGKEDQLQLAAALRALARHGSGDLVTVRDGGDRVRIWIDGRSTAGDEETE